MVLGNMQTSEVRSDGLESISGVADNGFMGLPQPPPTLSREDLNEEKS